MQHLQRHSPRPAGARSMRGLSLVELMVSIVIGLVILAALVALFVNTSGSNRELARANSLVENGRLAIELLESDVVHAGFWGPYVPHYDDQTLSGVPDDEPTAVPDPCQDHDADPWTDDDRLNFLHVPVQVYDSDAVCGDIVDIDGNTLSDNRLAGTDVLVVRHAELCTSGPGADDCEVVTAGKLYFQSSRCTTDVERYVLGEDGVAVFNLNQMDCATDSELRRFVSNIYYVRDYAVSVGDGIPTLMRSTFELGPDGLEHQPAVPVIEGIQGFRVELGVDDRSEAYAGQPTGTPVDYDAEVDWLDPDTRTTPTNRGDGSPDGAFVSCTTAVPCTVDQLMNVTAVKISLLVRSRDASPAYSDAKTYQLAGDALGPFDDGFKRHIYVSTLRLPNVAGRRQTP